MNRITAAVALAAATVAAGCRKTEYRDRQDTLDRLANLEAQLQQKDDYIQQLRNEYADLQRGEAPAPEGDAWVLVIEGDVLTVKARPASAGKAGGLDDAAATAQGDKFVEMVKGSRLSIQRCYEQALKKSSSLQARTVNLSVTATFAPSGSFRKVSFTPDLPDGFDTCLRNVASKWKLPAASAERQLQTTVKLTPT
jgi:hypothetical protein